LILDAPKYLYISTKVATEFQHLLESKLILSYNVCLPGRMATKWNFAANFKDGKLPSQRRQVANPEEEALEGMFGGGGRLTPQTIANRLCRFVGNVFYLSAGILLAFQMTGSASFAVQVFVLRVLYPLVQLCIGAVVLYLTQGNAVAIAVLVVVCLLLLAVTAYYFGVFQALRAEGGTFGASMIDIASLDDDDYDNIPQQLGNDFDGANEVTIGINSESSISIAEDQAHMEVNDVGEAALGLGLALVVLLQRQGTDRVQAIPALLIGSGLLVTSTLSWRRRRSRLLVALRHDEVHEQP
jgi:hypothetical protein